MTATKSWPTSRRKTGAKVDYQVAAPTVLGTPTMHRAKIAQQRVRMEGWRQRRPGSDARNPQEGKRKQKEKNILTGKKKKNILDTHRPSHGRTWPRWSEDNFRVADKPEVNVLVSQLFSREVSASAAVFRFIAR